MSVLFCQQNLFNTHIKSKNKKNKLKINMKPMGILSKRFLTLTKKQNTFFK